MARLHPKQSICVPRPAQPRGIPQRHEQKGAVKHRVPTNDGQAIGLRQQGLELPDHERIMRQARVVQTRMEPVAAHGDPRERSTVGRLWVDRTLPLAEYRR